MKRRTALIAAPLVLVPALGWADEPKVADLSGALRWLDKLEATPQARTTGAWPLVAVLEHLSQSIEMSMDGFPKENSALFQRTLGAAAFGFFGWRGRMSHGLAEPIPAAPPLTMAGDWKPAVQRLRAAIARFQAHTGVLRPHFAYGALDKAEFSRAHTFHIANHQDEIILG